MTLIVIVCSMFTYIFFCYEKILLVHHIINLFIAFFYIFSKAPQIYDNSPYVCNRSKPLQKADELPLAHLAQIRLGNRMVSSEVFAQPKHVIFYYSPSILNWREWNRVYNIFTLFCLIGRVSHGLK